MDKERNHLFTRWAFFLVGILFLKILSWQEPAGAQLQRERPEMLSATAWTSHQQVKPGGQFTLFLKFRVQSGAWFYGPNPGGKIIPAQPATLTFPSDVPLLFGQPRWPPPHLHKTDLGGQVDYHRVYTGQQLVTIPVKVKAKAPLRNYDLTVFLSGQVCTPKTCIPLKARAKFSITVGNRNLPNRLSPMGKSSKGNSSPPQQKTGESTPSSFSASQESGDLLSQVEVEGVKGSWLWILLAAFLGGIIMNVMPCVLPVVPLKVYSFLEHSQHNPRKAFYLALAFAGGILSVFLALGAIMASARALWGAQFQHPFFLITLGALIFTMGLWLMGAFTLQLPQKIAGMRLSGRDYLGSFGMGALATILATPCSGPFLGGAIAWAAMQPAPLILLTFATIGLGMALPYVLLVAQPKLLQRLPRPGPWMETWKQGMALVMFGVTIYFIYLLPPGFHVPFLLFLLSIGTSIWVVHRFGGLTAPPRRRRLTNLAALLLILIGGRIAYSSKYLPDQEVKSPEVTVTSEGLQWVPFNRRMLNQWLSSGETALVEWTADWCPNCKYIENTVFRNPRVVEVLKQKDVRLMRADITRSHPEAERLLRQLGGQSIPFSVVFLGNNPTKPIILRDVYTVETLLKVLREEG